MLKKTYLHDETIIYKKKPTATFACNNVYNSMFTLFYRSIDQPFLDEGDEDLVLSGWL